MNNSASNDVEQNDESGSSKARKVRGPTLLKDIWNMPSGKTIDVQFNNHDWRSFDRDQKKKLVELVRKRSQANRGNKTKQKMPHTGGSESIGTLMAEKDVMQEKLNNGETSNEQPIGSVAWEGDVYSQVLGAERSGYVRGLGLGPTPSLLWGSKSSIGNTFVEISMPQNFNGSLFGQVVGTTIGHQKAPETPHMSFQLHGIDKKTTAPHESQLPTNPTMTEKTESRSTTNPTTVVKTEANKKSMVQVGGFTSLLKLLRKGNDENVHTLAAEAIANLAMNGDY
ncbi:Armadillo-like helical [Sesbania bispinosa]|nr:Armadillo-like helical [Sesbania bispinosa]